MLGWVREYQPTASIIVVTGYPTIDSALNCLRAGTFDYFTKPFQISQLQHVVMRAWKTRACFVSRKRPSGNHLVPPSAKNASSD